MDAAWLSALASPLIHIPGREVHRSREVRSPTTTSACQDDLGARAIQSSTWRRHRGEIGDRNPSELQVAILIVEPDGQGVDGGVADLTQAISKSTGPVVLKRCKPGEKWSDLPGIQGLEFNQLSNG
jgi:hypothetical protein